MTQADEVNRLIELNLVHSLHTSEGRSFRGCRRRWDWIFHDGYYPKTTAKPLEFGVAFHVGMQTFYNPMTWHDRETAAALALVAFKQKVQEQYNNYLRLNEGQIDPESKADYEERVELGLKMLKYYTKVVSPKYDTNFKPVKVEIAFEVPIKDPAGNYIWCKCDRCWKRWKNSDEGIRHHDEWQETHRAKLTTSGLTEEQALRYTSDAEYYRYEHWKGLPVTYGGRIDMLAEDDYGRYWVFDWKTAARLSTGEPGADDDFLWLDDQISSYCWALWVLGIPVAGFVYAEIKKAVPEEPEPLVRPRLGRIFSVSKQNDYDYETYRTTIIENDPHGWAAGAYDDFLEHLKLHGGRFHLRHQIFRNPIELSNVGYNIWQQALDMTDPNLRIYPSPGRFSCGNCAFKDPCLGQNRGDDYWYTLNTLYDKRERHYYEREPSTDSKGGQ